MIFKQKIKDIAKLSRIKLDSKDIGFYQKRIEKIIDYIEEIKEVNTKGVAPYKGKKIKSNILRKDEVKKLDKVIRKKLINNAPDQKDNFLKTKPIFKNK